MKENTEKEIAELRMEIARLREVEVNNQKNLKDLKQHGDVQAALNKILQVSLLPLSLEEQLEQILELTLEIPWLALVKKGCVFLADGEQRNLKMVVQYRLPDDLLVLCKEVAFGNCLCGQVADSQMMLFKDCLDDAHVVQTAGMQPHGHYVVPIAAGNKLLGVLNLYVEHGHTPKPIEEQFLKAASKTLAGIIQKSELERLSYQDPLTKLPNRRHLLERLEQALMLARRVQKRVAVMFLDLDHFKQVNDTYGHAVGDEVLVQVAERIRTCVREMDTLARPGGDEFIALLQMIDDERQVTRVCERIVEEIGMPFVVGAGSITISVSIGFAFFPDQGDTASQLLKRADNAMYAAKSSNKRIKQYIHPE